MENHIQILDKGFLDLVESIGGDRSVIQAARVSYRSNGLEDPDKDKRLIGFLMENEHHSPFEHSLFKFHVKAPIFVFRQWHRHRIGVSYNEMSARYSEMVDEFYIPTVWRAQDTKNKQGSIAASLNHRFCTKVLKTSCENAMASYRSLLTSGVAREMARMVLPVNLYSSMYCTMNARSLMNFIALRSDAHAQVETRQYSHAMAVFLRKKMPWTFEAFFNSLFDRKNRDYSELGVFLKNHSEVAA